MQDANKHHPYSPALLGMVSLLVCLIITTGCSSKRKTSDKDIQVIDYKKVIEFLNDSKSPTALVDIRPSKQFKECRIPGSVNIPLPQITIGEQRLAHAQRIIVYANGWNDNMSAAAAKKLLYLGYVNVYDFRGGLEQWVEKGGQTIKAR